MSHFLVFTSLHRGDTQLKVVTGVFGNLVEALTFIETSRPRLDRYTSMEVQEWDETTLLSLIPVIEAPAKLEFQELLKKRGQREEDTDEALRNFLDQYEEAHPDSYDDSLYPTPA